MMAKEGDAVGNFFCTAPELQVESHPRCGSARATDRNWPLRGTGRSDTRQADWK